MLKIMYENYDIKIATSELILKIMNANYANNSNLK